MKMTRTEEAVWAAVYAAKIQRALASPPADVLRGGIGAASRWTEYERMSVNSACEAAAGAVESLRDGRANLETGYGPDSFVYKCYEHATGGAS